MKINLEWIKDYVKADLPPAELVEKLTAIGLVAESVEDRGGDPVLDLETYANRPDTLGHRGVAREISAMLGLTFEDPVPPVAEFSQKTSSLVDIQILDESLCPRYCGLVVKGLKVGPSPEPLRRRIESMGLKPINNVVDVSNAVLFATAQPIHIFDLSRIAGSRIIVRKAQRGEKLRTLEGTTVDLAPDMLVIADEDKPAALAGVIGGEDSGVTESTVDVFIESACFDPVSVRKTARRLGLSTDASYRFERGADIDFAPQAARMAAAMLNAFGGRASRGVLDVYPKPRKPRSIVLRRSRVAHLLGVDVPADFIVRLFEALGFKIADERKDVWKLGIPSFRVDIEREADLIEEIARFYGYDRIPSVVTPLRTYEPPRNRKRRTIQKVRDILFHQGFDEVVTYSFSDPEKEAVIGGDLDPVSLKNPISTRASTLRTNLLMGLLETAAWNTNRGLDGVHIFEIGNIYCRDEDVHHENLTLGLLNMGAVGGPHWLEKSRPADLFDLKGAVEAVLGGLRYHLFGFERASFPWFEDGTALAVHYRGEKIGSMGRVARKILEKWDLDGEIFTADLNLAAILAKQPPVFRLAPLARFPGAVRDLSILVGRSTGFEEIRKVLNRFEIPLLEGFELSDRYVGPGVPEGKVSVTLRFYFRHPQRTLQTEEVDKAEQSILGHLKTGLQAVLREGGQIDK
ncbi:MAG: phenylalanine--tRNA ligase subunit beta [Acidobacteriota bacterium]|nr:phenylalanine--tRNA ligase subunit beta [Acidobacteriota bacterium]